MIELFTTILMLAATPAVTDQPMASPMANLSPGGPNVAPNTVAAAIERAAPAVVKLYGSGLGRAHGYGTGVLVSADGQIVTTSSLLISGRNVRAVLSDGREFDAQVARTDDYRQLALLKIDCKDLPFLPPATTDHLSIGDSVIAIGNWFKVAEGDEPPSVNRGILSVRTNLDAKRLTQEVDYAGPILVYDAITANPGAPGGPLLDIDGNFVGLIGKIVEASATNTRLNYALPAEEIADFLGGKASTSQPARRLDHEAGGKKADLGVRISRLGYRQVPAYVERIRPGSPAATAGLRKDDLIVAVDGRRIADADAFDAAVDRLSPGQKVQVIVKRGNNVVPLEITAAERPK